jgi:hypothetical protein
MKLPVLTPLAVFLISSALAQTLAPELAPLAAKYDADVKTLDAAHAAAAATVRQKFLADLAAAEKSASDRGKVDEAAAILKARQAVAGDSNSQPIPGLSPSLQKRYADYLDALAATEREFAPRYQRIKSDYLRSLAGVEERLPATSPIREQIDGLKLNLAAASPQVKELVGVWLFAKSNWRGARQVNADGTVLDGDGRLTGKWTATAGELRFSYTDGQIDRFKLPPKKGQLSGIANDGTALTATKQK